MVCFWAVNVLVVWDGHFSLLQNFTIQVDYPPKFNIAPEK